MKRCGSCGETKPLAEFHRRTAGSEVRRSTCKECQHAKTTVDSYRLRHGLDRSEVLEMASKQGGCAICGTTEPGKRGWAVDHDHAHTDCTRRKGSCSECRRSILCNRCNTAIGLLGDDPTVIHAALNYVLMHHGLVTA